MFASVLLAILAVAACAVLLLRQNVLAGFGDYAAGIELDRLEELSTTLARRYRAGNGWGFIPATDRQDWIARELARLQRLREVGAASVTPVAPVAPVPPAPPAPPAPPLPPLPGPRVADVPVVPDLPAPGPLPLARRVSLLDAQGAWLAGRRPGPDAATVRRAVEVDGRTVGYLAVVRDARPGDALAYAFLQQLTSSLWQIVALAVGLSALAAVLLARHFRSPIRQLAAGSRALSEGHFDLRLPAHRSDELGDLARHFNALAARLAGAEQARRQWVADTSHELRTPLAVLRAQLEALQDGVRSATPDTLDAMLRQVLALNKLIDELYALARADVGALECKPVALDLWALACAEARGCEARFTQAGLALELGPGPTSAPNMAQVRADPDRMRQVLANLFENSLRYTAAGGRVQLHAQVDGARVHLHLDDTAPGVPDDALAHLGDRFYRVDASRSRAHGGAGLGLALCRRLVEAQGGTLAFAHAPPGGLRATITLPRAEGQA
ncbi:ATP-binding protein [Telluria mixta]|uniref:Signal transduction histidine-protein kinase/phosphatase MprB n=1 Tax=Telluria mixta TaxID=34071 RepID=A0ABT2BW19_9BURK|nr:ATP-binding protein [Telluria mixta]MCS0628624.1 ATP-binding protein [Telluria mixta]